jgi:hypothetical protein
MRQPSLFDPPKPVKDRTEAVERLRKHVRNQLYIVQRAQATPWPEPQLTFAKEDFITYSAELPEAERDELRAEFLKELERCRLLSERAA